MPNQAIASNVWIFDFKSVCSTWQIQPRVSGYLLKSKSSYIWNAVHWYYQCLDPQLLRLLVPQFPSPKVRLIVATPSQSIAPRRLQATLSMPGSDVKSKKSLGGVKLLNCESTRSFPQPPGAFLIIRKQPDLKVKLLRLFAVMVLTDGVLLLSGIECSVAICCKSIEVPTTHRRLFKTLINIWNANCWTILPVMRCTLLRFMQKIVGHGLSRWTLR